MFACAAVDAAPPPPARVLELGCGAGLAALMLAHAGHRVTAVDVDPRAVAATRANAHANCLEAAVVASDWDRALAPTARFDLVIVNPPFLSSEPPALRRALFAGHNLEAVAAAIAAAGRRVAQTGRTLLITSERTGRTRVEDLIARSHLVVVTSTRRRCWGELYHLDVATSEHGASSEGLPGEVLPR